MDAEKNATEFFLNAYTERHTRVIQYTPSPLEQEVHLYNQNYWFDISYILFDEIPVSYLSNIFTMSIIKVSIQVIFRVEAFPAVVTVPFGDSLRYLVLFLQQVFVSLWRKQASVWDTGLDLCEQWIHHLQK